MIARPVVLVRGVVGSDRLVIAGQDRAVTGNAVNAMKIVREDISYHLKPRALLAGILGKEKINTALLLMANSRKQT